MKLCGTGGRRPRPDPLVGCLDVMRPVREAGFGGDFCACWQVALVIG